MVGRPGLIAPEITETYGVSIHTVTKTWARHPEWPDPVDKRGRYKEYDAQDVADFVRDHIERQAVELEPRLLYTAQQLEDAGIGIKAGTIRADLTRGRWPEPDDTADGVNRWYGATATKAMADRRGYRRST
ncbi:hypothetical protein G5C60_04510 [Streptomyces sp. HC44]|uniref:Uncharacterized protein n=1 Tax=Streptomyces scabichelini TaxID=2711217 RepID=A0A6G4UYW7_9ACTN|nr:hypothetical protein [Streptomyces scabichelini]NGO06941.1 hypothetical protein [Streptomyces scabichelini]